MTQQQTYEVARVREETVTAVEKRIAALEASGGLHFPPDYSPQNALKSAWLILQNTVDKDQKPVLESCSKASIVNSLLDMVITGLNPAKKQGYFIAYGKQLVFQRSYFGSEALAKRVDPKIKAIVAEVVYESDVLEYEIRLGQKIIIKHNQKLENVNSSKIKAVYCLVINQAGEITHSDIMTFDEVKKSWEKSKMHPVTDSGAIKPGSTHAEFTAEMCKKTIINRVCKPIFNSSDDKYLKLAASRSEVVRAEEDAEEEISDKANKGDIIDVDLDEEGSTTQQEEAGTLLPEEGKEKEEAEAPKPAERIYISCDNKKSKAHYNQKTAIEVCENNCGFFMGCKTAQDAIKKAMELGSSTQGVKPGF